VIYGYDRRYHLVAFDAEAGLVLWESAAPIEADQAPAVARHRVVVSPLEGAPVAFDSASGDEIWRAATEDDAYMAPVVLDDAVYVRGTWSGTVYALSLEDGALLGSINTDRIYLPSNTAPRWRPISVGEMLIIPAGTSVYAYGPLSP
jgi:outer membrane protein assembly factor BamB